jgi:hypothetical protein
VPVKALLCSRIPCAVLQGLQQPQLHADGASTTTDRAMAAAAAAVAAAAAAAITIPHLAVLHNVPPSRACSPAVGVKCSSLTAGIKFNSLASIAMFAAGICTALCCTRTCAASAGLH